MKIDADNAIRLIGMLYYQLSDAADRINMLEKEKHDLSMENKLVNHDLKAAQAELLRTDLQSVEMN